MEDGLQNMDTDESPGASDDDQAPDLRPEQAAGLPPRADEPKQGSKQKGGKQGPGGRTEMDPGWAANDPTALDADMDNDSKSDQRQGDEHSFAAQLQRATLRDEAALGTGAETSTDVADPQGISPARLEMLREQVAQALHGDGAQGTSSLPEAAEYGQQMWSRCEALTSGAEQAQHVFWKHPG